MFQSFTGSSRRPRQVNLSGRNNNPFAATSAASAGPHQAVQSAHQDRQLRQQQRQHLNAAKLLQKTWRGHSSRQKTKNAWRNEWDRNQGQEGETQSQPYTTLDDSLASLTLLLLFFSPRCSSDVARLIRYTSRQRATWTSAVIATDPTWQKAYLRLLLVCLQTIETRHARHHSNLQTIQTRHARHHSNSQTIKTRHTQSMTQTIQTRQTHSQELDSLLNILTFLVSHIPKDASALSIRYYTTLADIDEEEPLPPAFHPALLAPLPSSLLPAYEGFVSAYLSQPHDPAKLAHIHPHLDIDLLTRASANVTIHLTLAPTSRLWLLGQYIYLVHVTHRAQMEPFDILPHIPTIARLLASLADDIAPEAHVLDLPNLEYHRHVLTERHGLRVPLNTFLHDQIQQLVDQKGIRSLLASPESDPAIAALNSNTSATQLLAGYALTLLRMFPLRADDIRMWLYLGPSAQTCSSSSIPAIAYFWRGARQTKLFGAVVRDPRAAVTLLTAAKPANHAWQPPTSQQDQPGNTASEWRVMIVFLELYTFVLKIMDDEEFLGGENVTVNRMTNNALSLADIKDLTIFLKNLGFAMYYHAQDIADTFNPPSDTLNAASLSRHFGGPSANTAEPDIKPQPQPSVAGIMGMSLDYLKGLVTGLLRAVYERDSRRQFLPKGHWLMTSPFDMANFIQAVVGEEERRKQLESQEDDHDLDSDSENDAWSITHTSRAQNRHMRLQRDQRRASKKRYLQVVAPRLEILQNMPFLIPFETRVEVFREFVRLDQAKRRGGYVDSDAWRSFVMFRNTDGNAELSRHHAVVRRKHELQDAFEAFYPLGADLKEPIQITFKDEFGIQEAGIDGGGVTKEFLTSVTSEAFNPMAGFFSENPQHLLYPNPASVESLKADATGEDDDKVQQNMVIMLQQYEFLGRIVGKCLYEGILIDVGFAGFFLTQWSLFKAGPLGQSAYRPTINDLRDLDEALHRGLLNLKSYPGDVEEDMGLNFTVTDELITSGGKTMTVESELTSGGSNQAVTNENRLLYISLMTRWRLVRQPYRQTAYFLKGLSSIIEPGWLSMFNQLELQTLIGGAASSIDVADLRRNTQYGGVYVIGDDHQEHDSIKLFWQVMETMTDEDRRKLLKFVTSTPRAPLLGFGSLNPRFSIRDSGDDESRFPTTSTCVNLLKLPRYKSAKVLRDKLLYAVNSGAGFDLS